MTGIQQGFMVLADISGYTAFVAQTELQHSREILDQLLGGLVRELHSPLVISKLEGDAVFAYAPKGSFIQGQTLLEAIEQVYFSFRTARDRIHRACQCAACTRASDLDLKFIAHFGPFDIQTIGSIRELLGQEVIVIHRLLKNRIVTSTGVTAYAFFTEAASAAMPLGDLKLGMIEHSEAYEYLGVVHGYVHNLTAAWDRDRTRRKDYVSSDVAWLGLEQFVAAPPSVVWDFLNNPRCICEWCGMKSVEVTDLKLGRLGVGSGRYCVHAKGKQVTVDSILDYQPFDYVTVESSHSNGITVKTTTEIAVAEGGSRVTWRSTAPRSRGRMGSILLRVMSGMLRKEIAREVQTGLDKIRNMVHADIAASKVVVSTPIKVKNIGDLR